PDRRLDDAGNETEGVEAEKAEDDRTDERAQDSQPCIRQEAEAVTGHDLASKPARDRADRQYDQDQQKDCEPRHDRSSSRKSASERQAAAERPCGNPSSARFRIRTIRARSRSVEST